jgi:hypothetical protein
MDIQTIGARSVPWTLSLSSETELASIAKVTLAIKSCVEGEWW